MNLKILNPKGEIYSNTEIKSITLPTSEGIITVRYNHTPIISLLGTGEIEITQENGEIEYIFISSGLIRIENNNNIYIMADTSEFSKEIDLETAKQAKQKAEDYIKNNKDIPDTEFARLQGVIEREVKRIEIANLHSDRKDKIKVKVEEK